MSGRFSRAPSSGAGRRSSIGCWRRTPAATARERLTLIRLFEELRALGYDGGYDAVRRYARTWSRAHAGQTAEAYVPLSFAPGEAYQFDWSHEVVLMSGVTVTVKVAHVRLCHSRMMFVRAYPRETQEMVFDAHERAFAFFKGACTRGIYDNMKTAVETVFVGKDRQYNRRFLQMCAHHLVDPVACTPACGLGEGPGREPGRPGARALLHPAAAGEELRRTERLADGQVHRLRQGASPSGASGSDGVGGVRGGAAEAVAYRGRFDGFHALPASVSKTCLVRFDNNKYSVNASAVGRPVEIHAYADRIVIRQDGRVVAEHRRSYSRGETIYDPWHYVPVLARKPGALRNGAPFRDWVLPAALERVRRRLAGSDDGDRQMVAILAAVLTDGLPAVEAACAAGDGRGRSLVRRDHQHPHAASRSGTDRHHPHAGCADAAAHAGRRLRQIRSTQEPMSMERTEVLDMMGDAEALRHEGRL